ncbi:MAG: group III truncated hemoglobin [Acidovorax sp.]|uniref:group III truncated hemoglobin n=1 Tax=Acidovorax sp. TaxID=1872122 RepID=UPI00261B30AA|nr:group III truncated hemoglobin [Acidovorax sp.]MDH4427965.1 group III truncated hemoglobin [Acidovorax sp.]
MNRQPPTSDGPGGHAPPSVESITQLVHGFYGDVRQDPLLGPVFEKALHGQWDTHLKRLVDFWSTVALGSRSFKGDVFGKHMVLQGVTPAHFAAWVGLWQLHTNRLFAPEVAHDLQVAAHGIARNLFRGYFDGEPAFAPPRHAHDGRGDTGP